VAGGGREGIVIGEWVQACVLPNFGNSSAEFLSGGITKNHIQTITTVSIFNLTDKMQERSCGYF